MNNNTIKFYLLGSIRQLKNPVIILLLANSSPGYEARRYMIVVIRNVDTRGLLLGDARVGAPFFYCHLRDPFLVTWFNTKL